MNTWIHSLLKLKLFQCYYQLFTFLLPTNISRRIDNDFFFHSSGLCNSTDAAHADVFIMIIV